MAAFDRVLSGIPQMDECFDNIRLGDNVVWRVDRLEDFRLFVEPYVEQAIRDGRNLIYIRFASHEPFFTEREGLKTLQEKHPDIDIYCGCLDDHLNENAYIVPGLGDAGDRIFGTK